MKDEIVLSMHDMILIDCEILSNPPKQHAIELSLMWFYKDVNAFFHSIWGHVQSNSLSLKFLSTVSNYNCTLFKRLLNYSSNMQLE